MAQETRPTLKAYFETGDIPTQGQFTNLIDSMFNITDDTLDQITEGSTKKTVTAAEKSSWNARVTQAELTSGLSPKLEASDIAAKKDFSNLAQSSGGGNVAVNSQPYKYVNLSEPISVIFSGSAGEPIDYDSIGYVFANDTGGGSINVTFSLPTFDTEAGDYSAERVVSIANGAKLIVHGSLYYDGTNVGIIGTFKIIIP